MKLTSTQTALAFILPAICMPLKGSTNAFAQAGPMVSTNAKIAEDALHGPITDDEFKLTLDPATAAKVEAAIHQLSSPEYKQREEATNRLIEFGASAFAKLREAYRMTDDPEVRQRIERIVRAAYLDYYVLDQFGYLGISMSPNIQPATARPQTQNIAGIKVGTVMANTGAARAGLHVNDIIIGIDGTPMSENGMSDTAKFSEQIRSRKPGTKMKLTVVRDGKQIELEPILGRAPTETARAPEQNGGLNITVTSSLARLAENRFEVWWPRYFNPSANKTASKSNAPEEPPAPKPPRFDPE